MLHALICVVFLCITLQGSVFAQYFPRNVVKTLTVNNGGSFGIWYPPEFCAEGTFASGYNMKIQPKQGSGDDTALNAISLHCDDATKSRCGGKAQSGSSVWGNWRGVSSCKFQTEIQDFLTSFSLQVESYQGRCGDDTTANYLKFMCRDLEGKTNQYEMVHPPGKGEWGSYEGWSETCPPHSAICGIQTRIADPQCDGDDTGLNDVRFFCCT